MAERDGVLELAALVAAPAGSGAAHGPEGQAPRLLDGRKRSYRRRFFLPFHSVGLSPMSAK